MPSNSYTLPTRHLLTPNKLILMTPVLSHEEEQQIAQIESDCFAPGMNYPKNKYGEYLKDQNLLIKKNEADAIIGALFYQIKKDNIHITNLIVALAEQRHGIGKMLLLEILKIACENNKTLYLESPPRNQNYYEKFGFKVYRTTQAEYWIARDDIKTKKSYPIEQLYMKADVKAMKHALTVINIVPIAPTLIDKPCIKTDFKATRNALKTVDAVLIDKPCIKKDLNTIGDTLKTTDTAPIEQPCTKADVKTLKTAYSALKDPDLSSNRPEIKEIEAVINLTNFAGNSTSFFYRFPFFRSKEKERSFRCLRQELEIQLSEIKQKTPLNREILASMVLCIIRNSMIVRGFRNCYTTSGLAIINLLNNNMKKRAFPQSDIEILRSLLSLQNITTQDGLYNYQNIRSVLFPDGKFKSTSGTSPYYYYNFGQNTNKKETASFKLH